MKKQNESIIYSTGEVKTRMEKYLDVSARRLQARLQLAWKKQAPLKTRAYDKAAI